jgi:hypothetical protein
VAPSARHVAPPPTSCVACPSPSPSLMGIYHAHGGVARLSGSHVPLHDQYRRHGPAISSRPGPFRPLPCLHERLQHRADPCLVASTMRLEPAQHLGVQPGVPWPRPPAGHSSCRRRRASPRSAQSKRAYAVPSPRLALLKRDQPRRAPSAPARATSISGRATATMCR